jgi:hypothetical protein
MDDPLSRALLEVPGDSRRRPAPDLIDRHTQHPHATREILEAVKAQVLEALALPFFDGPRHEDHSPIVKVGFAEAGSVQISVSHREPPYRADVTLDVRTDFESPHGSRYRIRGRCEITRDVGRPSPHREFAVRISINDDGSVTVDVTQLRAEMASAIRSIGTVSTV